ncbi:MAG: hypothetical protein PVG59_06120, partial [Desulfobacterales bacterium]
MARVDWNNCNQFDGISIDFNTAVWLARMIHIVIQLAGLTHEQIFVDLEIVVRFGSVGLRQLFDTHHRPFKLQNFLPGLNRLLCKYTPAMGTIFQPQFYHNKKGDAIPL